MRRVLIVLVMVLLAVPSYAQRMEGKQHGSKGDQSKSAEQQERKRAADKADKAYRDALKSIPDKATPTDPWKNVR